MALKASTHPCTPTHAYTFWSRGTVRTAQHSTHGGARTCISSKVQPLRYSCTTVSTRHCAANSDWLLLAKKARISAVAGSSTATTRGGSGWEDAVACTRRRRAEHTDKCQVARMNGVGVRTRMMPARHNENTFLVFWDHLLTCTGADRTASPLLLLEGA